MRLSLQVWVVGALALACCPGVTRAQDAPAPAAQDTQPAPDGAPSAPRDPHADAERRYADPGQMPADVQPEAQVTDRRGEQVPLDATFFREDGTPVTLGDLLHEGQPVLLQFVYFRCPGLCTVALNGMIDLLEHLEWTPGDQLQVLTISINPEETPNLARGKKGVYLEQLRKAGKTEAYLTQAAAGWHFLTGNEREIERVAAAAGFGFKFDPETKEFAHGAGLFVLTPSGVVSRTHYGAYQEARTMRLSLVEAANGEVGSALDRVLLYCYAYDPISGKYTAQAWAVMRLAAGNSVLFLAILIFSLFRYERRKQREWLAQQQAVEMAGLAGTPSDPDSAGTGAAEAPPTPSAMGNAS